MPLTYNAGRQRLVHAPAPEPTWLRGQFNEQHSFPPPPAPAAPYWADEAGRLCILLSSRRKADAYELIPLSTDIGGCAFRWFKKGGGESYDVPARRTDHTRSGAPRG